MHPTAIIFKDDLRSHLTSDGAGRGSSPRKRILDVPDETLAVVHKDALYAVSLGTRPSMSSTARKSAFEKLTEQLMKAVIKLNRDNDAIINMRTLEDKCPKTDVQVQLQSTSPASRVNRCRFPLTH